MKELADSDFHHLGDLASDLVRHFSSENSDGESVLDCGLLFLGALCRGLGKSAVEPSSRKGRLLYPGHEAAGALMVKDLSQRLELSLELSGKLQKLVGLQKLGILNVNHREFYLSCFRFFQKASNLTPELLLLSLAEISTNPGEKSEVLEEKTLLIREMLLEYFERGFLFAPTCPVGLMDLQMELGVTAPSFRRQIFRRLEEGYVAMEFSGREDGLERAAELLEMPVELWSL